MKIKQFEKFVKSQDHVVCIKPYLLDSNAYTAVVTNCAIYLLNVDEDTKQYYFNENMSHIDNSMKKFLNERPATVTNFPDLKTIKENIKSIAGRKYGTLINYKIDENNTFNARYIKTISEYIRPETAFLDNTKTTAPLFVTGKNGLAMVLPINTNTPLPIGTFYKAM